MTPYRLAGSAALALVLVAAAPAHAQQTGDAALAETLFQDGKRLMDAGAFATACPKIADSHRLDPAGGTVLLLALCWEGAGKTASAWAAFNDALAFAKRDGRADREKRAQEHIAALEPRLSRLTIVLGPAVPSSLVVRVTRDGSPVPASAWGTPVPIDPGEHEIAASAQGKRAWSTRVKVEGDKATARVEIPALEDEPAAPPPAAATTAPTRPAPSSGRRTAGLVVGGAGVVALGVGAFFGVRALGKASSANDACPGKECSDREGIDLNDQAKSSARIADVALGLGLVATGVGAYLFFTSGTGGPGETAARGFVNARPLAGGAAMAGGVSW